MKKLLFLYSLIFFISGNAQDLRDYIPSNTNLVGSINGGAILDASTLDKLNEIPDIKKVLKSFSDETGQRINSLDSLGFDTQAMSYFYFYSTDSISYLTYLFPRKEPFMLDDFLHRKEVDKDLPYSMVKLDRESYIAWDDEKIVFVLGFYKGNENLEYDLGYTNEATENAYYAEEYIEEDLEFANCGEDDVVEVFDFPPPPEPVEYEEELVTTPYFDNYMLQDYAYNYSEYYKFLVRSAESDQSVENIEMWVKNYFLPPEQIGSINSYDSYALDSYLSEWSPIITAQIEKFSDLESREKLLQLTDDITYYSYKLEVKLDPWEREKELTAKWIKQWMDIAMNPQESSILTNGDYNNQYSNKSIVNVWCPDMGALLMSTMTMPYNRNQDLETFFVNNYGPSSADLFFEDDKSRVVSNWTLKGELSDVYKRMSDQKINKKFFKYMNEDQLIGYLTYNINSKNTLEEYPNLMTSYLSGELSKFKEETLLFAELMTLLIDEEAIGEIIRGDVVLVLTGVNEKEVTYTDYQYDENYDYKLVEKTKKEKLPDFLFMATSKEVKFTNNLISYLLKKKLIIEVRDGIYKTTHSYRDFPLDLYFTLKNDMFFLGTSLSEISDISDNTYKSKISSKNKKLIKKGICTAYFKSYNLTNQIGELLVFSQDELDNFQYFIENSTEIYFNSSKIKNDKVVSELVMTIPEGEINAITYVLNIIDHLKNY